MGNSYRVVYLTGAPASGKSSVTRSLEPLVSPLEVFEYGQRLTAYLAGRGQSAVTQTSVREKSAAIVSPADVQAVDELLLRFVAETRTRAHVIIDSHAVTKESFGFRVTPFSLNDLAQLAPDRICVLFTSPDISIERIGRDPSGRPVVTPWESSFHTSIQGSVAVTYGVGLGIPVYFVDAGRAIEAVARDVARLFTVPEREGGASYR